MLVWISLVSILCAYSGDLALNYAESFFDAGYYEEAITEYKRFIFFNPSSENLSYAYSKIGMAYRNQKKWIESTEAFRQSIHAARNDSIKNEREIALAITFIASENYSAAEILLLRVGLTTSNPLIRKKASFFQSIASLYGFKWKPARDALQPYLRENPQPGLQSRIDSLFLDSQNLTYKSPTLAMWLSTFLPGSGQIYAGDWGNGLNAFLLNGGLASAIIYKITNADYMDAYVIYYFLFRRYYFGNRFHAARIADDHNRRLKQSSAQQILDALILGEQ